MKDVVFYHSKCYDGTMAAAAAKLGLRAGAVYYAITYQKATAEEFFKKGGPYEYVKRNGGNLTMYFVDFSPKIEVIAGLRAYGHDVVILDHHKSSQEDLAALKEEEGLGLEIHFDMTKSGARLAWEYFHPHTPVPRLVEYVEDRDLWRWSLPSTKEAIAWLGVSATTNDPDSYIAALQEFHESFAENIRAGVYIIKEQNVRIKEMAERFRYLEIEGFGRGAIVNAPVYPSEVAEYVYENNEVPFVIVYAITADCKVSLSFRSKAGAEHSIDVTTLARVFGGGGHRNASGGVTDLGSLHELLESSVSSKACSCNPCSGNCGKSSCRKPVSLG